MAPAPGAAKSEIRLGSFGTQSGPIGAAALPILHAAKAWSSDINARGGLAGHPVRVILADDGGDPSRALALAKRMVEEDNVLAFYACQGPTTLQAVTPYLEARQIPLIHSIPSNPVVDESPMVFNATTGAKLGAQWAHLAGLLRHSDKRKVGLLYCREVATCSQLAEGVERLAPGAGVQIVFKGQVSLAQPDFTAECVQAQRSGADGVMTGVDGPSIVRIARSCAQQGYKPQYMTASLAVIESIASDPNLDGLIAPQGNFPHMATDLAAEQLFQATMAKYAPSVAISPAVATVWAGGALLREVSKKLPDGKVGSADFFPGLYSIKKNTLGGLVGPLSFNEGSTADEVRCVFFIKVVGGKFTAPDGSKQHCF